MHNTLKHASIHDKYFEKNAIYRSQELENENCHVLIYSDQRKVISDGKTYPIIK